MNDLTGLEIANNYKLEKKIGNGAMGEIYLAVDLRLDRHVAVKILNFSALEECSGVSFNEVLERFKREAKAIANVSHPNIVNIYDIGIEGKLNYIVIEYIDGSDLSTLKKKNQLNLKNIVEIGIKICDALDFVHNKGIIHRDIKPSNIMLTLDNQPKLMDFGLAQLNREGYSKLTQEGSVLGSLLYISPEQLINSANIDSRADIYSFGATLYELLTGRYPIEAENVPELVVSIMNNKPVLPSRLNKEVPELLDKIIEKALEKNPNNRYQSAKEMENDLLLIYNNPSFAKEKVNENFTSEEFSHNQEIDKTMLLNNNQSEEKINIEIGKTILFHQENNSEQLNIKNETGLNFQKMEQELQKEKSELQNERIFLEKQKKELNNIIDEKIKLEKIEKELKKEKEIFIHEKEFFEKQKNFNKPEITNTRYNHITHELQNSQLLFDKSKKYIEMEDYDTAIGCLKTLIDWHPKVAEYHSYLGIALSKKGWDGYAQAEFKVALHFDPSEPIALKNYLLPVSKIESNNHSFVNKLKNLFKFNAN